MPWLVGRVTPIVGGLALAAAALIYVTVGRPADGSRTDGPQSLLPDYALVASSDQSMRGTAERGAVLHLHGRPDAPFEITARPATAAGAKVVAYLFAVGEGEPSPIDARVEIAGEGAIRMRGQARALDGARELRVVIGASGSIRRYEDALQRARAGTSDAHVRVLAVSIVRE